MNKYLNTLLILLLSANLLIVDLNAQEGLIHLPHLTMEDGLSFNQITQIFQDNKGFMWLGTYNGLNRYDGSSFKIFLPETDNPKSISSHHITSIYQDSKGTLWIGTNHGLNRYDFKTETYKRYLNDPNNPNSLSHDLVYSILEDKSGSLWIGTYNALNKYDRKKDCFSQLKIQIGDTTSSSSLYKNIQSITCMLQDFNGNIWLGTWDGLTCMQPDGKILKQFFSDEEHHQTISYKSISCIYEDKSKNLWIGTNGSGLHKFNQDTGKFIHYLFSPINTGTISNNYITVIFQDKSNDLWIGTKNGLNKYDSKKNAFERILNKPEKPLSIINNEILSIYEDRANLIWVGTAGGVSRFHKPLNKFQYYKENISNRLLGLSNNNVNAVFIDKKKNIWIGTLDGLNKIEPGSDRVVQYKNDPANKSSISDNYIMSICEDQNGYIWIGTYQMGLNKYNPQTGENKIFVYKNDDQESLSNSGVTSIYKDHRGTIWVGTWYGLNRYNKTHDNFIRYENDPDDPKSLSHNLVWSIFEDSKNMLWVGTDGGGVCVMDPKISAFKIYKHNRTDSNSICDDRVFAIFESRDEIMWFGTSDGISSYNRETGKFKSYTKDSGLPDNQIASIQEDNNGFLWIATQKGLSCFNRETETFINYTKKDGIKELEFNSRVSARGKDGILYFGSKAGLMYFDPPKIVNKLSDAPIVFTNLKIYNETVPIDDKKNSILRESITTSKSIRIPYENDVITIEYALLYFSNASGNTFYYKLSGFENNWNNVGNRNSATYTNLPPGDYTFHVKATNNDGIKSKNVASIELIIVPAYYQTIWFKVAVALGIFLTTMLFFHKRTEKIKKQNKLLEKRVAERTKDLDKTIYELNQEVTERIKAETKVQASLHEKEDLLEEKEILLKEIHHRVKNNLQVISSMLYLQSQYIQDPAMLDLFEDSRNRIKSMGLIHEKLYQSKDFAEINFNEYVSSLLEQIRLSFNKGDLVINEYVDIDKAINLDLDTAISCGLIINEIMTNVYKYAFPIEWRKQKPHEYKFHVVVKVKPIENNQYEMLIYDNGIGFKNDVDIDNFDSLGLKIISSMVKQLNGTISINGSSGTEFKIIFDKVD